MFSNNSFLAFYVRRLLLQDTRNGRPYGVDGKYIIDNFKWAPRLRESVDVPAS